MSLSAANTEFLDAVVVSIDDKDTALPIDGNTNRVAQFDLPPKYRSRSYVRIRLGPIFGGQVSKRCQGRTPMATFNESMELLERKIIDKENHEVMATCQL